MKSAPAIARQGLLIGACLVAGSAAGAFLKDLERGPFLRATQGLSEFDRTQLESQLERAMANAAWIAGDKATAQWFTDRELLRAPEAVALEDPTVAQRRVRALLRLTALSSNPEGQSAILNNVCALERDLCKENNLLSRMKTETSQRLVPPGDQPPPFLLGLQHPTAACEY